MAVRREDFETAGAVVYRFPTAEVRARVARHNRRAGRRRLAVAVAAASVAVVAFVGGRGAPTSSADAPRAVVLAPGQTLWDVAERHAPPGSDPRAYVDAVIEANGLSGPPAAGQRISLPR